MGWLLWDLKMGFGSMVLRLSSLTYNYYYPHKALAYDVRLCNIRGGSLMGYLHDQELEIWTFGHVSGDEDSGSR